jgi:hypothetical protein
LTTLEDTLPSAADLDAVSDEDRARLATAVLPPTPDEIDAEIAFYQNALACAKQAQEIADKYKASLVLLADHFGSRPEGAEQSLRLQGRRNTLTVTRGTTVAVNEQAVADLKHYLGDLGLQIFEQLFRPQTTHKLVEGARSLLKKLSMPRRAEEKVLSLFGRCIDVKPKAPAVKVEVIKPEKPLKKSKPAKKAA